MTTHDDDQWEEERVEVTKPVGAVISVRVPADVAERIYAEAQRRGLRTSALVREAIDSFLEQSRPSMSSVDLSISSQDDVAITLYTGQSQWGRTEGTPSKVELLPS